jgi:thiamine monophosphate kinase
VGALLDDTGFPAVKVPQQLRGTIKDPLSLALHGGDDYELLFTAPREKLPSLPWKFKGLLISPIGMITSGTNVVWYDAKAHKGYNLRPGGWDPFRQKSR